MQISLEIPEDLGNKLTEKWGNISQKLLESLVVEAYQEELITKTRLQEILGLPSPFQVEELLKNYRVYLDNEVYQNLPLSADQLRQEVAIVLFQQEYFTLGQASHFAKINQLAFQKLLASRQIGLHYDIKELHEDAKSLRENGWR